MSTDLPGIIKCNWYHISFYFNFKSLDYPRNFMPIQKLISIYYPNLKLWLNVSEESKLVCHALVT